MRVLCTPELEPGLRVTGHRVTGSAIWAGSGRVTGQFHKDLTRVLTRILVQCCETFFSKTFEAEGMNFMPSV